MVNEQFVSTCLNRIDRIVPFDSIFTNSFNYSSLPKYYKKAGVLYKFFHSKEGAMHSAIRSEDAETHENKLLFHARSAAEIINKYQYNTILELGCGFGFNSIYLASIFPDKKFIATDITEANLKNAKARAHKMGLTNISFIKFNYNDSLHSFKADLIFGIETFCYCTDLNALFKNISTSLLPNGRILIYDGYERPASQHKALTEDEIKAYRLLCYGFYLNKFQNLEEVYTAVKVNHLSMELESDYSQDIYSNYKVMEKGSLRLLKFPLLIKVLMKCRIISYMLFMQSLAGLFSAYFLEKNFMSYYAFVIKKGNE